MKTINLVLAVICYFVSFCCLVSLSTADSYEVGGYLAAVIAWGIVGFVYNLNYLTLKRYESK